MPLQVTITAGMLRHRVGIGRPAEPQDQDTFGEPGDLWAIERTVWGLVEDLSGDRLVSAQAIAAEATTQVTIRWRPGLNPRKCFVFEGRQLNILHVGCPDQMKVAAVCLCSEEVQ